MIYGAHRTKAHSCHLKGEKFPKESSPGLRKASRLKNTPIHPSSFSPAFPLLCCGGASESNTGVEETRMMAKPKRLSLNLSASSLRKLLAGAYALKWAVHLPVRKIP